MAVDPDRPAQPEGRTAAPVEPLEHPATVAVREKQSPEEVRRSAWWWIRAAAVVVTLFVGYQLLLVVSGAVAAVLTVILYVVFGAIVSFIAGPAVDALERHARLPRTVAILLTLLGGLLVVGVLVYLAAGPVVDEARALASQVPSLIDRLSHEIDNLTSNLKARGVPVSAIDLGGTQKEVSSRLESILLSSITGTITAVVDAVITLVVAFWLLKDGNNLRAAFVGLLPATVRRNVEFALDATGVVIGGYVRAQLFLALVIGVLAGVGCAILGVPFPIVVGIAAGVFELIPLVGPFVGGAVGLLLALTVSPLLALFTLFLFLGIHVIEGYVLAPRIQAKFVQLHPLVALLALFAGIEVAGFLGALFAVPAASLVAVFIRAAVGDWRAQRPDLFAVQRADLFSERRRETILGEFRLFKRSPLAMLRDRIGPSHTEGEDAGSGD